jgi:hypothetical protein
MVEVSMATRAELFRAEQERQGPKKAPMLRQADRQHDPGHTMNRNLSKKGDRRAGAALEDSASGRPSRKSTRPSSQHGRNDTTLMKVARDASLTPKAAANRSKTARGRH